MSLKMNFIVIGTFSEGLIMYAFPQAIAYGRYQNGIMAGKLNGQIVAHTPTGWSSMVPSIPGAISSEISPLAIIGIR